MGVGDLVEAEDMDCRLRMEGEGVVGARMGWGVMGMVVGGRGRGMIEEVVSDCVVSGFDK